MGRGSWHRCWWVRAEGDRWVGAGEVDVEVAVVVVAEVMSGVGCGWSGLGRGPTSPRPQPLHHCLPFPTIACYSRRHPYHHRHLRSNAHLHFLHPASAPHPHRNLIARPHSASPFLHHTTTSSTYMAAFVRFYDEDSFLEPTSAFVSNSPQRPPHRGVQNTCLVQTHEHTWHRAQCTSTPIAME